MTCRRCDNVMGKQMKNQIKQGIRCVGLGSCIGIAVLLLFICFPLRWFVFMFLAAWVGSKCVLKDKIK